MLPDIDFLPKSYRQDRQSRRRQTWRAGIAVAFLVLTGLGIFAQYQIKNRLNTSEAWLQSRAKRMASQLESDEVLYETIRELDAKANLLTRLQVRVATTRLLADVTASLPPMVSLTEFRLSTETLGPQPADKSKKKGAGDQSTEVLSPTVQDLTLLEEHDMRNSQVISIQGVAPDDVAVSHFLSDLEGTKSFDDVRLHYINQYLYQEYELRSFSIQLRVRKPRLGMLPHVEKGPGTPTVGSEHRTTTTVLKGRMKTPQRSPEPKRKRS